MSWYRPSRPITAGRSRTVRAGELVFQESVSVKFEKVLDGSTYELVVIRRSEYSVTKSLTEDWSPRRPFSDHARLYGGEIIVAETWRRVVGYTAVTDQTRGRGTNSLSRNPQVLVTEIDNADRDEHVLRRYDVL